MVEPRCHAAHQQSSPMLSSATYISRGAWRPFSCSINLAVPQPFISRDCLAKSEQHPASSAVSYTFICGLILRHHNKVTFPQTYCYVP